MPDPLFAGPRVYAPPPRKETSPPTFSSTPVFLQDLRLTDDDEVIIFDVAPSDSSHNFQTFLRPTYLAQLLGMRTPTLPAWFTAGFLDVYRQLEFAENTITLAPFVWLDAQHTAVAKRDINSVVRTWLPLVELLSEDSEVCASRSPATNQIAANQRQLLMRWALDPVNGARRDAFWKLVDRGCNQPVTERLFVEVFGETSSEFSKRLADYLRPAIREPLRWQEREITYPELKFTDATPAQNARIRGDWERLQASYVREASPDFAPPYLARAHRTLRRAYERGERDPRLLGVLGLAELDGGDLQLARSALDEAANAGVVQPKAYVELARLRLAEAVATSGNDGKMSTDQADTILRLLTAARAQSPPLLRTYLVWLDVWAHCAIAPGPADFAFLAEGTQAFPRSAELAYRSAAFLISAGRSGEATALVETATNLGASDAYFNALRNLRARLNRGPAGP